MRQGGFGLVELLFSVVIVSLVIGAVLVYGGRAMRETNAAEWTEAAQRMIQSVREGYKDGDSTYAGLSEQVARANGWVPDVMWNAAGSGSAIVPWNGTWSLHGRTAGGASTQAPLQMEVVYGAQDSDVCVSVTNALRRMVRDIRRGGSGVGGNQGAITNPTPNQIVSACRSSGSAVTLVYGFAY